MEEKFSETQQLENTVTFTIRSLNLIMLFRFHLDADTQMSSLQVGKVLQGECWIPER